MVDKKVDIKENIIYNLDIEMLGILLIDRTTNKNIIQATNERHQEDFNKKHGNIALKGFDRYDTFFEYPDRDASGNIIGFTRYKATTVVRLASDDKFYLYDIIDIKK